MSTLNEILGSTVMPSVGNEECINAIVAWEQPNGGLRLSFMPGEDHEKFVEFIARLIWVLMNPDTAEKESVDLTGPDRSRDMNRSERRRFDRLNEKIDRKAGGAMP